MLAQMIQKGFTLAWMMKDIYVQIGYQGSPPGVQTGARFGLWQYAGYKREIFLFLFHFIQSP